MPRTRREPPPEGDQIDIEDLLEEVRGLRERNEELGTAVEELRSARTPSQRRSAQRDVDSAEEGLVKALRQHGYHDIGVDDLEEMRRGRRESEFEQWFEKRLQRMDDELAAEADAAASSGGKGKSKGKAAAKGKAAGDAGDDGSGEGGDDDEGRKRKGYF